MNNFVPRKLEAESESESYTDIQSKYIGNLNKMKLLEAGFLAYDMMGPFIIPSLLYEYALEVEY